jgi:hypothetical protein
LGSSLGKLFATSRLSIPISTHFNRNFRISEQNAPLDLSAVAGSALAREVGQGAWREISVSAHTRTLFCVSKFRLVAGENRLRGSRTVARGFELPVTPGLRKDISNCIQPGDRISMARCDSHLDPVVVSVVRTSRKSRSESVESILRLPSVG